MSNPAWIGRVLVITDLARSRYFKSNSGLCSVKFLSDCGRPASSSATFNPASARRLQAQPPDAPEPTTITSNFCLLLAMDNQTTDAPPHVCIPPDSRNRNLHPTLIREVRLQTSSNSQRSNP